MKKKRDNFKLGDSVAVKPGTLDPDFEIDIGGWQGRVSQLPDKKGDIPLCLDWDSLTLKNIPEWMFEQCEKEQMDWTTMCLDSDEVELTQPRDTEQDVLDTVRELSARHKNPWRGLEDKGARI